MNPRPSYRELNRKLEEARQVASARRVRFVDPDAIYADLLELDFLIDDLQEALPKILQEMSPKEYLGQSPPQRSYEKPILDSELYAFGWDSRVFGCPMYLKFSIRGGYLWIVSLHRDRK
jgi:hypothetical protein